MGRVRGIWGNGVPGGRSQAPSGGGPAPAAPRAPLPLARPRRGHGRGRAGTGDTGSRGAGRRGPRVLSRQSGPVPARLPPAAVGDGRPGCRGGCVGAAAALSAAAVLGRGLFFLLFIYLIVIFRRASALRCEGLSSNSTARPSRAAPPPLPVDGREAEGGGKEPPGGAHRGAWHRSAPSPDPVCRRGARSEAACEGRELRGLGCAAVGRERGLAGGRRAVQKPCRGLLGLSARGPEPRCSFGGWM